MWRNEQVRDKWVNDAGNYLFKDSFHMGGKDNIFAHNQNIHARFVYPTADAKATPVWT